MLWLRPGSDPDLEDELSLTAASDTVDVCSLDAYKHFLFGGGPEVPEESEFPSRELFSYVFESDVETVESPPHFLISCMSWKSSVWV